MRGKSEKILVVKRSVNVINSATRPNLQNVDRYERLGEEGRGIAPRVMEFMNPAQTTERAVNVPRSR